MFFCDTILYVNRSAISLYDMLAQMQEFPLPLPPYVNNLYPSSTNIASFSFVSGEV